MPPIWSERGKVNTEREKDYGAWIEALIQDFIDHSPANTLQSAVHERAFDSPLVGFSRGDDPLYEAYKRYVGSYHWTPGEIFTLAFPGSDVNPEDLTVIAWILPQTRATKEDNRKERIYPSERWARARIFGEGFNIKLRQCVVSTLLESGIEAVAPMLFPQWERKDSDKYVFASTWSERHAAYASGLGTFGLCDGLITPKGKAIRVGSVVAGIKIPRTVRPYEDHHAYCLFYTKGACGLCIDRCPVGAVTEAGHEKRKCREHIRPVTSDYVKSHYGFDGYGCGLCQTGVPCESKIPTMGDLKRE